MEIEPKMTETEKLNHQLYEKMFAEQEKYREWLLGLDPEEILNHTYEYTTREDILLALEYDDLTIQQATALLKSPTPLEDVFCEWDRRVTDRMSEIWQTMSDRADTVIQRENQQSKSKKHEQRNNPTWER